MSGTDKDLVEEYIEKVWNCGELAALNELTTPDFVYHLGGQPPRDLEGMRQFIAMTRDAFPDWRVQIESIVSEGALVAVSGINFYRLEGVEVAEEWEQTDSLGMLGQLGMLPN